MKYTIPYITIYFFFYETKKHITISNICLNHVIKYHVTSRKFYMKLNCKIYSTRH